MKIGGFFLVRIVPFRIGQGITLTQPSYLGLHQNFLHQWFQVLWVQPLIKPWVLSLGHNHFQLFLGNNSKVNFDDVLIFLNFNVPKVFLPSSKNVLIVFPSSFVNFSMGSQSSQNVPQHYPKSNKWGTTKQIISQQWHSHEPYLG
jgi:hypothetical protein